MRVYSFLAGVALAAWAPVVGIAEPVTYSWIGTVTDSTGDLAPGATVSVSVTLDRGYPADANTKDPKREATYSGGLGSASGKSPILAITIDGANAQGWFDRVHVEKNLDGLSQVSIQSALPQCCRSVSLVFSTTMKGVVKSVDIPKTLFPSSFQSSTFAVTYTESDSYGGSLN